MDIAKVRQQFEKQGMYGLYTPEEIAVVFAEVDRLTTEMAECESRCEDCERENNRVMAERDKYKTAMEWIASRPSEFIHGPSICKYAAKVLAESVKP